MAVPLAAIVQPRDGHHFTLRQPHQCRIDHVLRGHDDFRRQVFHRIARFAPEVGRGGAREHRLDAHAFVGQLPMHRLAQAQHKRLGPTVHSVEDFRGDGND
ncbi:hypothetical protein D3C87_1367210 [compost metagenome]